MGGKFWLYLSFCIILITNADLVDEDDGKSSLVFVFDTTGSMYNDLRQLREGAEIILKTALEEGNVIADFVFVPFHDPAVGPATVTKDIKVFEAALNIVRVYGGGDCPEKSLGGIQLALSMSRPRSFVYVFTDATASDHRLVGKVLDLVQRKQSQVVFVLTGHCNDVKKPSYQVYHTIAAASSGQVFNLNKTSVHKVLDFVRTSIKGRNVNLATSVNPPGYNYTQEIPVDKSVGEVTVSVAGARPQIHVVNPSGRELTGPPQLITTLDLSEIMVVKVLKPEPGNWSITAGSAERHSVRVAGATDLTFRQGFAVQPPVDLLETSYRPLLGTYNHLLISLTETKSTLDINYAEILNLNGQTLFKVPLKKVDENKFLTDAFIPPKELFYIAINGRYENGQEVRRVGSTAVQAKPPDVPYLNTPAKVMVRLHQPAVLSCRVESLVPVSAAWARGSATLAKVNSLQSTAINYVIANVTESDAGEYSCVASNAAGRTDTGGKTVLELIVDPPHVSISPADVTLSEGAELTVSCSAFSEELLRTARIVFDGARETFSKEFDVKTSSDGVYNFKIMVKHVSSRDSGKYTCIVGNRGGTTNQTIYVTIQMKPIAQILGPHTISKSKNADVQIVCHVDNALEVQWLGPKNDTVERVEVNGSYNAILNIKNLTNDSTWTCVASQNALRASDLVQLTVLIKPRVRMDSEKNITVLNGTITQISCTVVAKPTPRILWHRETEEFLNNTVTIVEPNVYKSVLTLNSSNEDVAGCYFCFGENSEGIDHDSVTVSVRRKMTIIQGLTDTSVELYSKATLQCRIDAYPPPSIIWRHNGTVLPSANIEMSEDDSSITIRKVDFDDLGVYTCEVSNGYENITIAGSLTVHGLEIPVITKIPSAVMAKKGEAINLTCRIKNGKPEPSITWVYRSDSGDFTNLPQDVVEKRYNIEFTQVKLDHEGEYRCIAENVVGRDMYDVVLTVQYPPEITHAKESHLESPLEVLLGEKITLSCNFPGIPPPIVAWSKDSRPIAFSNNIYLTNIGDLVVEDASEEESGTFTCNASNPLGSVQKNFTVNVFMPPKITVSGMDPTLEVLEGQLVELPCSAQGVPRPSLKWLQNGEPVVGGRKHINNDGLRFIANLTDFGEYSCTATNDYGSASLNYTVYVWVAPYIKRPMTESKEVITGSDLDLACDAVGFPLPSITWEFREEALKENSTDLSFNELGGLMIRNASVSLEGLYACVAENGAGVAVKYFFLTVNEPPKFVADDYTGPYIATEADAAVSLACAATGRPPPRLYWLKDGYYLDRDARYQVDSDGTLVIEKPSEDLSGVYSCLAKNSVGNDTRDVVVKIYSLPRGMQSEESRTVTKAVEGDDVEVACPVGAGADSVKWYKDAVLISNGTLKLSNVSRANASAYACVASNAVGSAHAPVALDVDWPPRFLEPGVGGAQVVAGQDASFDCTNDAKPRAKTKWLFNSKLLLGEDKDRLKVLNTRLRHTGVYKCVVRNQYGTIFKQFTLDVLEPPRIMKSDDLEVQLKAGSNATLECDAKGSPEPVITWSFDNTNWSVLNSSLVSSNVSLGAAGEFRCEARNVAGASHMTYRVTVAAPARITDVLLFGNGEGSYLNGSLDLVLEAHARIACYAEGIPPPSIKWLRHGNTISRNDKGINYADLMLSHTKTTQGGEYYCVATNEGGFDERKMKINVLEPPRIYHTLFENAKSSQNIIELQVLSGQSFFMHCHPYGNPVPEIYWFKDGLPLRLYDDTMVSTDFGEVIVSNNARQEQSGNYTCVARNKVGETSAVYLLDVLVAPPKQKDAVKTITAMIGEQLNLTCPAEGTPLPYARWIKLPYTDILDSTKFTLLNDNYTLIINKPQVSDSGKYSCIMTNKVGNTEVVFDVTVEKPPTIAGNTGDNNTESYTLALGRSLVLKCEVDGNPEPKISWLKDIQQLCDSAGSVERVLHGSMLALWALGTAHAGRYTCLAQNRVGLAQRRYDVHIKVPGKWSEWSQWSYCNVTCGLGYQVRSRLCQYIADDNSTIDKTNQPNYIILDETTCKGTSLNTRKCHMPACETSLGRWAGWARWSACSASCGAGSQTRSRRCRTPPCSGERVQIRKCPDLPKCASYTPNTNDVFSSGEDDNNPDYLPAATFEMQPEDVDSSNVIIEDHNNPTGIGSMTQPLYYDVIVTENLDHSDSGPCEPGLRYNVTNNSCDDIDECVLENNACHATQVCANTAGAYRCGCPRGFHALGAGQRCLDVNECAQGADGCEWACVNVAGGFVCACPKRMRLRADRRRCYTPSSYSNSYEDSEPDDYPSMFIEYPERYTKSRN